LTSEGLFEPIFVPAALREAVGDGAWLQAMLDAEAALARAAAPREAAEAIARCCAAERFDAGALGEAARAAGNPVVPLVRALREAVGGEAARHVHRGATSQDILDTAAMLVARRALELVLGDLDGAAAACARLAGEHRATLMAGRTLLQQALPTTFGLKAAGWLVALVEARERLAGARSRLAGQLGGAAGTLAAFGDDGLGVLRRFAAELELAEPALPWHTDRVRTAELGAALAIAAGAVEKIALDVVLLAQTEVGEVAEAAGGGRGGSSTLPHKRNPIGAVVARACAQRARAAAGVLLGAMAHEHERAAGAWHAEWEALRDALALTGGAAAAAREALDGLQVNAARMRANLDATGDLLLAERAALAGHGEAVERALASGRPLRESGVPAELLDQAGYLGSADALVYRALAFYRS